MKFNNIVNRFLPEVGHIQRLDPSMTSALFHHPYFGFNDNIYRPSSSIHVPLMDIQDIKDSFLIIADCPGMNKDQIEIDAQGNTLTIKGHREQMSSDGMVRQEREISNFERMVTLPASIKATEIKASLKDGVLEIRVPKEKPESTKIVVED